MLTKGNFIAIITFVSHADVAQLAEQLICNQQVAGSSPIVGSNRFLTGLIIMEEFPSGQREQTVNLLAPPSLVRIQPPPPIKAPTKGLLLPT